MRVWEAASVLFFVYVAVVAALPARPRPARLGRLYAGVFGGLAFIFGVSVLPPSPVVHEWLAPPVALLLAYWTSGLLFVSPQPGQERLLLAFDRRLRILETATRLPRIVAHLLEVAYLGVYPLIPLALVLHLWCTPKGSAEGFWTVILLTDYVCFGVLAWVQTRPPHAIESTAPWQSSLRRFNLRLLGAASIRVNTFPSGHAAEALAAALLAAGAPWPIVAVMFANALAISAGAVFGRYHYAADAISGWAVAFAVWALVCP